jgi:5'(3')-deoxyribonucleotidase
MVILVDLDNVLINTGEAWVEILNERHGTTVKYDDVSEWDMTKFFPTLTRDEVYMPLSDGSVWERVSPIPGARETIQNMIDDGDDVYVVTSSSLNTIGRKWKEVLQKFFPMIKHSHVIVAERKQMIMGDVLIDDAPFNLEGGMYYGILFNAPHNAGYDGSGLGIERARDWNDTYFSISVLKELFGEVK